MVPLRTLSTGPTPAPLQTVSLDAPSGVDAGRGEVFEPSVNAIATLTLALPKVGLFDPDAARKVGELYCADISVPPGLYARFSVKACSGAFRTIGDDPNHRISLEALYPESGVKIAQFWSWMILHRIRIHPAVYSIVGDRY